MSFDLILREIVGACPGALGAALMGGDGIPIEQVAAPGAGEGIAEEVGVLGVEFGRILEEARKAAHAVDGGPLEELSVRMARFQVVIRSIDAETYLVLALAPEGNAGKGRFLLRRHSLTVRAAL